MKIKNLTKEELEAMRYSDIAFMILTESSKKQKITDIFKKTCNLLELTDQEYEEKIADFFQVLSTDHRFIMLEKGFWDLKSRHQAKIIIEDDEDDEVLLESSDDDSEEDSDLFYDSDETDDTTEDDLKDLVIVTDDEDEANASI